MYGRRLAMGLVALAIAGCGDDGGADGEDAGGAAGLAPEAESATAAVVRGLGAAQALTGPLVGDGENLRDDSSRRDLGEGDVQTRVEDSVSGSSIVTDAACTTYAWTELTATITFTDCVLEATGETLDGIVELTVTLYPTTFQATLTSLVVGDLTMDGTVQLVLGGRCREGDASCTPCRDGDATCARMREEQRTLLVDVSFTYDGEDTSLAVDSLGVEADATGATLSGNGSVTTTSADATFTASMLHWNQGECLPSSGTLTYDDGTLAATITFLPTTPDDGVVQVQVGMLPPFEEMLLPPCGST